MEFRLRTFKQEDYADHSRWAHSNHEHLKGENFLPEIGKDVAEEEAAEVSCPRRTPYFPVGWHGGSPVMRNTGDLS